MALNLQNLLGALALALGDAQTRAAEGASGLPTSAASAIVSIGHTPGMTIKNVAHIAGVSHSVMVRIIEGLVSRGMITRAPGKDKRAVGLKATAAGAALRDAILAARSAVLTRALDGVDAAALTPTVAQILTRLTDTRCTGDHMCRLCDEATCTDCPVEARACQFDV
jgi:DNA-binding MarR family transcriptional regulator